MTSIISTAAIAVFFSGALIGILAILVAGTRSDDRDRNLTSASPPSTG